LSTWPRKYADTSASPSPAWPRPGAYPRSPLGWLAALAVQRAGQRGKGTGGRTWRRAVRREASLRGDRASAMAGAELEGVAAV